MDKQTLDEWAQWANYRDFAAWLEENPWWTEDTDNA